MRQLASLAWKEWHESRWLLVVALGVFLGLPLAGGLEAALARQKFAVLASPWVFSLGGILAVFVGVDAACRDLRGRLEDFWRSRPMGTAQWLLVKYFVGLAVVLVACILPLVVELRVNSTCYAMPYPAELLLPWCPFLWAALYSLGFAAGSLLRRGAHAAMLALSAMLLVYFLPVVLPPIKWMGLAWVIEGSENVWSIAETPAHFHRIPWLPRGVGFQFYQLSFVGGMLGICVASLALAVGAVRRNLRIESGVKLTYWSVGTAMLILFASAAFQLATNLPILHTLDLPPEEDVIMVRSDGGRGVLFTRHIEPGPYGYRPDAADGYRALTLSDRRIEAGPLIAAPGPERGYWSRARAAWQPDHPDVVHFVRRVGRDQKGYCELVTASADPAAPGSSALPLWRADEPSPLGQFAWKDRLYAIGLRSDGASDRQMMATLDISDTRRPKVVSIEPRPYWGSGAFGRHDMQTVDFPPIAGMSPRELLRAAIGIDGSNRAPCIDGDVVCGVNEAEFFTYRLKQLDEHHAVFEKVGQYAQSMLDKISGTTASDCTAAGGLVYVSTWNRAINTPRVTVFDIRDPKRPHPVGHFAVPGEGPLAVWPLPDGRALIGGRKLYLVGPPPRVD
ncbi:MAG: hypothetical protein JWL69_3824 [Phycisphaerales bacterium]|nr:hypothetical protein [Phycisphaerales bacterium]